MRHLFRSSPALRITLAYLGFSLVWIAVSDWLLTRGAGDSPALLWLSMFKGWLFVVVTAGMLYLVLRHWTEQRVDAADEPVKHGHLLSAFLGLVSLVPLPSFGIVVIHDLSRIKESESRLDFLVHHGPLTELPNRLLLVSRLDHAIEARRVR